MVDLLEHSANILSPTNLSIILLPEVMCKLYVNTLFGNGLKNKQTDPTYPQIISSLHLTVNILISLIKTVLKYS